jgi:regulatory protein
MQIQKNQENLHLFFDGACHKILNATLWKRKLQEFKGSTSSEFDQWFAQEETKICKIYALKLLARKNYYTQALEDKLKQKKCSFSAIKEILLYLKKEGFISDEKFLESYIEKRKRQLWGPKRVFWELQSKGFAQEEIQEALDRFYSRNEEKRIQKILFSKIQKKKNPYLFMQKRGFVKNRHDLDSEEIQ